MGDSVSVSSLVVSFSPCFGVLKIFLIFQTLSIVRTWEYLNGNIVPGCQFTTKLNNRRKREEDIQYTPQSRVWCYTATSSEEQLTTSVLHLYRGMFTIHTSDVQGASLTNDIFYINSSYKSVNLEIIVDNQRGISKKLLFF